ncbi:hypothetical protein QCN29_26790 [Streptomyces sp. HNM0663]|uniref:Glycosyltransferase n=1 Tax=Streptomyces chengmaiensis TaxID=3040919 RepID=A0ABT6HWA2_9ACTN|nr:hypothetical protein [Streptomyces chengmaiensis]MDH2392319.1 hypothetical protein [Streptomyces chengmaiensis]
MAKAPPGPWCKAAAVSAALPQAVGDVLVVADADVWCDGVPQAVKAVEDGAPWAIPHGQVHRLTEAATTAVLGGGPLDGPTVQRPYTGFAGGGIAVLPRATYEDVPLDARFAGWGQEDEAWALALLCLAGRPWRGRARLWHLWHPPQVRTSRRWGSQASRALWQRYHAARADPQAMRTLLDEMPKEVTDAGSGGR